MKKWIVILLVLAIALPCVGGGVPPFTTIFMRTVLDDSTSTVARATLEIILTEFGPLILAERSSDPDEPAEGKMIIWMSDGTEYGDDGDLIIAATAGGVARVGILWDFSAADLWNVPENVIYAAENVIFAAEQVVYP